MKKIRVFLVLAAFIALAAPLAALEPGFGLYGGPATTFYFGSLTDTFAETYGVGAAAAPGLAYSAGAFGELWFLPWLGAAAEMGVSSWSGGMYALEAAAWTLSATGLELSLIAKGRIPLGPLKLLAGLGFGTSYLPVEPVEKMSLGGVSTVTAISPSADWLLFLVSQEIGLEYPLALRLGPLDRQSLRAVLRAEYGLTSLIDPARFRGDAFPLSLRLIFSLKAGRGASAPKGN